MQGVVVIGPIDWDWESIKQHQIKGATRQYEVGANRFVIEFDSSYVAFNYDPALAREFDEGELRDIPFSAQTFVLVEYKTPAALKCVLCQGVIPDDAWLDDDRHPPVSVRDFRDAIEANPGWDWRCAEWPSASVNR